MRVTGPGGWRQDFLHALSRVSRGTTDEKVRWVFDLYDLDGDGLITKHEMQLVVTAIYDMLGRHVMPRIDQHAARNHVDTIFHVSSMLVIGSRKGLLVNSHCQKLLFKAVLSLE